VAGKKRVLDVGNCSLDHGNISTMLEREFGAEVKQTHLADDTLAELRKGKFDLVLINRKLDADYSDGMEILTAIKRDPQLAEVPVMVITNYPEHQDAAVAAGAVRGFGKKAINSPETRERLAPLLSS
jgi:CheY-like chemotaxis protein